MRHRSYRASNPERTLHTVTATTVEMVGAGLLLTGLGIFIGYKLGSPSTPAPPALPSTTAAPVGG